MNSERLHGREGNFHGEVANSIQQKGRLWLSLRTAVHFVHFVFPLPRLNFFLWIKLQKTTCMVHGVQARQRVFHYLQRKSKLLQKLVLLLQQLRLNCSQITKREKFKGCLLISLIIRYNCCYFFFHYFLISLFFPFHASTCLLCVRYVPWHWLEVSCYDRVLLLMTLYHVAFILPAFIVIKYDELCLLHQSWIQI